MPGHKPNRDAEGARTALVLLPTTHLGDAVERWLCSRGGYRVARFSLPEPPSAGTEEAAVWVAQEFRDLSRQIEQEVSQRGLDHLRETVGFLELFDPHCRDFASMRILNPKEQPRIALAALLVLAFPEVQWLLFSPYRPAGTADEAALLRSVHCSGGGPDRLVQCLEWHRAPFVSLFDPTGIRNALRRLLRSEGRGEARLAGYIPMRRRLAAALDEEDAYASFNAYVAYRFGYRTWSLSSWRAATKALGDGNCKVSLVFEDLFLAFPDRPAELHLSCFRTRDKKLTSLGGRVGHRPRRVLVTVGHERSLLGRTPGRENKAYLRGLGIRFRVLFKPTCGVFELWRRAGLWDRMRMRPRAVEGFCWPPAGDREVGLDAQGHSSAGPLLAASDVLISRARRLSSEARTVLDAVHAAVLALEAKELLGCRTPTTALEALALQHEAEVMAESMFLGVEYNIAVRDRFREIEREVEAISRWFARSQRRRSAVNARLAIIERLAKQFRRLNQIEEEIACLAEARTLRFEFWTRERPWRWLLWPVLRYVAFTLHSLPRFVAVVVGWAVFFGLSYYIFGVWSKPDSVDFWDAMVSAWKVFFTGEPVTAWTFLGGGPDRSKLNTFWNLWLAFQGAISFTNLGLFLSHLYLIVSRR